MTQGFFRGNKEWKVISKSYLVVKQWKISLVLASFCLHVESLVTYLDNKNLLLPSKVHIILQNFNF